jgi:hypothetical protein
VLEVQPINRFARAADNFPAVTFDERSSTRLRESIRPRWRVVPAQNFIERMRVKQYPLMALFDATAGLGTEGGARTSSGGQCRASAEAWGGQPAEMAPWRRTVNRQTGAAFTPVSQNSVAAAIAVNRFGLGARPGGCHWRAGIPRVGWKSSRAAVDQR